MNMMYKQLLVISLGLLFLSACANATELPPTATIPSLPSTAVQSLEQPTSPSPETPSSTPQTPASLKITDALGRTVELPAVPQRIVITGKALFMIADAVYIFPAAPQRIVGLGNAGQGASNFISLIDPEYEAKAVLGSEAGAEQVAALNPDLVILKSYLSETVGKPIEALGIAVIYIDLETPEQYQRDLLILGQIFQNEAKAQEVANFYHTKVEEIQNAIKTSDAPSVLLLYYNDKDGKVAFNVPPMSWIQTQMVLLANGQPVWQDANLGKGWTQVTLEQIAAWDADYIFLISYFKDPGQVVESLKTDPQWQALRAVKNKNLFAFPGDLYSWDQPDPRWILGLSWLAAKLHPGGFPQWDSLTAVTEFYQTLYGLDSAFVEQNILPALKGDLP
ncbi:MAG: ABC transporter substrate-binding protein [Chloroflexota bacterium]